MQNTCLSSTIAFRSKRSVCYSSNDYYLLNNRVNTTSSCTCCAFPFNGMFLNPKFFYGLKQSTLIHCSASKRLILGGGDRFFRLPICDFGRFCYGESYSGKGSCQCSCPRRRRGNEGRIGCMVYEKRYKILDSGMDLDQVYCGNSYPVEENCHCSSRNRRRGKEGRLKCMNWEEKAERCDSGSDGCVEELLSLLVAEDNKNCVGVKERRSRLSSGRIQAERRVIRDHGIEGKKSKSDRSERNSEGTLRSVVKSREIDSGSAERREGLSGGNCELRKDGSSCSSYYSVLSSNEIDESDLDIQDKHGQSSDDSLIRNKKERRRDKEDISVKNVIRQSKKNEDDAVDEISKEGQAAEGSTLVVVGSDYRSRTEREKMLTDISIRQEESRTESLKNRSKIMESQKSDAETNFSSKNQFSGRGDNSVLSTSSVPKIREQLGQTGSQVAQQDSRRTPNRFTEMSQIQDSDIERASSSQPRLRGREENLGASLTLLEEERVGYSQIGQSFDEKESRRKSQQLSAMLESQDTYIRDTPTLQSQFVSTLKNRDVSSMSSFHKAEDWKSHTDRPVIWEPKATKESQDLSNISVSGEPSIVSDSEILLERRPAKEVPSSNASRMLKNYDNDVSRTSTSQRLFASTLENRETSSFSEVEVPTETAQRVVWETESTKDFQEQTNISVTIVNDMRTVNDSHELLERRMGAPEDNSASHVDLSQAEKEGKTRQASGLAVKQLLSRKESKRLAEISSFGESSANKAPRSQQLNIFQQASEQRMDEEKENATSSQVMVTPPPYQPVHRATQETVRYGRPTDGNVVRDVYSEMPGSGSSTMYTQEMTSSSPNELDGGMSQDNVCENQSNIICHEDALGSANRLEESSAQFVRQFVEKLSHEVSTSEHPEGKIYSQPTSINKDAENTQQSLSRQVSEDVISQVHDPRRSSSRSGARGPSDEMWDVSGPSVEEPARTEAPGEVSATTESATVRSGEESSTSKSAIVKGGRSLWGIIGDIVRLRWGAQSDTHKSTSKSGGKSSSNESGGSEAWFSSHDADEKDEENVKKGKRSIPKVYGSSDQPSLLKDGIQSLVGASEGKSLNEKILKIESGTSSLDIVEGISTSKGVSSASKELSTIQKLDEKIGKQIPSSTSTVSSSSPLHSRPLMRSPAVNREIPENSKGVVSRSDFVQMAQPVQESPNAASGTEVKDRELKRRKLQRNKQVEKEIFEDWEEAYRLESEQRKIDEMFMKEALLEAKKAADTWEVPVGAVLVQHGRIVARGCNLVEELRDSTAHAELICIREASKILRTWRLADTTLYVTLEPCAMCAGAILQARVDTVVWGAPNKLLGADGSWVRLFPGGGEAGGSSDLTSQPAGPVHPFHPKITIRRGILATECGDVMQQFFQLRRKKDKKLDSPPTSSLSVSTHPSKFISKMHGIFNIMFCL